MLLTELSYEENKGLPSNWRIENVKLGGVSLVVGKNSSGKTRLLNVIDNLAKMISGRVPIAFGSGTWECHFERLKNQAVEYQKYKVDLKNQIVADESFEINRQKIMQRGINGSGFVLKKSNKAKVNYKVPTNQLMAVVRRDEIQHPYFDHLYKWGAELCCYRFGSDLGKSSFTAFGPNEPPVDQGLPLANFVDNAAHVFRKTNERFGSYKRMILDDLESLGYPSKDVLLGLINNFLFNGTPPMQLGVLEEGRALPTYQSEMSQGMYRALAISVQLNANITWAQSTKVGRELTFGDAPTVVIDDIGEGLDFTRSKALVKRLMEKAREHSIQLIMSSNDRFIMNDVPLENWVILHREGSVVKAFDYINSKDLFDEFQYLGLNNFDFFSGDLFLRGKK